MADSVGDMTPARGGGDVRMLRPAVTGAQPAAGIVETYVDAVVVRAEDGRLFRCGELYRGAQAGCWRPSDPPPPPDPAFRRTTWRACEAGGRRRRGGGGMSGGPDQILTMEDYYDGPRGGVAGDHMRRGRGSRIAEGRRRAARGSVGDHMRRGRGFRTVEGGRRAARGSPLPGWLVPRPQ